MFSKTRKVVHPEEVDRACGAEPQEGDGMKGVARHPVIAFTALTYLLSWWPLLVDRDISGGIFPFGPTLAAIIVTALLLG
ncbi:MAG: hypothetical protein ACRDL1_08885, partial [Solirubrobacterales bacterium]